MEIEEVRHRTIWQWLKEMFWSPGIDCPLTRRFRISRLSKNDVRKMKKSMQLFDQLMRDGDLPQFSSEHPEIPGLYALRLDVYTLDETSVDVLFTYGVLE